MTTWPAVFDDVERALQTLPPPMLNAPRFRAWGSMAKAWYGNPALHYEIWVRPRLRVVELGLHFEADDLTNARLLAAFRTRVRTVKRVLGADVRIEEWDKGWARVWEPISLELPPPELPDRVKTRFVAYVTALEPILREELPADVEWRFRATATVAGRRARRGRATSSRASRSGRR